jgi:hypothetical protein
MNILQIASELNIRTPDADVFNAIRILLNRFSYDFTEEQRSAIAKILEENQPPV